MEKLQQGASRRTFLQSSGVLAAGVTLGTLAGMRVPSVHAAENHRLRLAFIGTGGRGTGAVMDAMTTRGQGPIELYAMADLFADRLNGSYAQLADQVQDGEDWLNVSEDRKFVGFDAYKKAIDCLEPGNIVMITTPPAFRPTIFAYAVSKGMNVFMEKPLANDVPGLKLLWASGEEATKRNLKVGVGLMCRHCDARHELLKRIRDGEIGEIMSMRTYRVHGPAGVVGPRELNDGNTELEWQMRRYLGFFWASGGVFNDYLAHNVDECCWMKGSWPVKVQGTGARAFPNSGIDQNFDNYNIEYTFADGAKLHCEGRFLSGCWERFASYANGTKGAAVISTFMHTPAKCRLYSDWKIDESTPTWEYPQPEPNPYYREWEHLVDAVRNDKPYNETQRGGEATMAVLMGMYAVHSGREVTWEQMLNSEMSFMGHADLSGVTRDTPAPVSAGPDGVYPRPQIGKQQSFDLWY